MRVHINFLTLKGTDHYLSISCTRTKVMQVHLFRSNINQTHRHKQSSWIKKIKKTNDQLEITVKNSNKSHSEAKEIKKL